MNTAPATVTALPAPLPNSPSQLDVTPPLGADAMTAAVVVHLVGVVIAAAHADVVRYRKGGR